jgi:hypothetical protein
MTLQRAGFHESDIAATIAKAPVLTSPDFAAGGDMKTCAAGALR